MAMTVDSVFEVFGDKQERKCIGRGRRTRLSMWEMVSRGRLVSHACSLLSTQTETTPEVK